MSVIARIWSAVQTPAAFLFVLGVLVFIHELGHFLMARWHGVKVHTFSLGFGPKLLKFVKGGTEYCVSVVPLGGYVKLAGETVEDAERTGAPDEFLSKSKWVRFQVYLMGPVMNLALAVLLLAVVLYRNADEPLYPTQPAVIGTVLPKSAAERGGLQAGDRVVRIGGREIRTWDDFDINVVTKANRELDLTVVRGTETLNLRVTPSSIGKYEIGDLGVVPVARPQVLTITPGRPADRAGLKDDDVIVGVGGESGLGVVKIVDRIRHHPKQALVFNVLRGGQPMDISIVPEGGDGTATIGAGFRGAEFKRIQPGPLRALRMSVQRNWEGTVQTGRTLAGFFTRETEVKQLLGPVAIADLAGGAARLGFMELISLMAMISLQLGLMNLLPIPVLDGGHIAILGLEGLSRRDFSVKVKERILLVGFGLILALMVTVIYNDVARILR